LEGRKFRRQHSVGHYILDFYCPAERIAVELDGQVHQNSNAQYFDAQRDQALQNLGIKVLRFENKDVFDNLDAVLQEISTCFKN
jgi:very-short-patch-repair endonuclease